MPTRFIAIAAIPLLALLAFFLIPSNTPSVPADQLAGQPIEIVVPSARRTLRELREFTELSPEAEPPAGLTADTAQLPTAELLAFLEAPPPLELTERLERVRVQVRDTLGRATVINTSTSGDAALENLLNAASNFVALRYGTRDPRPYIRWRTEAGYDFIGWDWLHNVWDFSPTWAYFVPDQGPLPHDGGHLETFARLFNVVLEWGDGANRPLAIADDPRVTAVIIATQKPGGIRHERLRGTFPPEFWTGAAVGSCCPWWKPPRSDHEIAYDAGGCDYASIGMVVEFENGIREPMHMTWIRDPARGQWFLQNMGFTQYRPDGATSSAGSY